MQIPSDILLLAAVDWWEYLIGIIFFILYGLGQLMGAREEVKKKAPPRPAPKPQAPPPRPGQPNAGGPWPNAGGAPPNQADPLRAEVEEFLRRAQGKQAEPRRPAPSPARQMPPRRPSPAPATVSRPGKPAPPPSRPQLRPAEPEPAEARREGVAEHVARHVVSEVQEIAAQTSKLGAEVALADDRMDAHLQEKFQHQVGSLEHREQGAAKQQPLTVAEEIRQLIRQPAGMRQLIIAGEILRRPEERW